MKPEDIFKEMKEIEYGWIDKNNQRHYKITKDITNDFMLQTPDEVLKNKLGVCWDQVEYQRKRLNELKIPNKTYMILQFNITNPINHTFLVYEENDKYYWFENSIKTFKGIKEYQTLEELFNEVIKIFKVEFLHNKNLNNISIYEYPQPKPSIGARRFMMNAVLSNKVYQVKE